MDEFSELSIGDNSSTASNVEHDNVEYAASGDVDNCKEKLAHLDSKSLSDNTANQVNESKDSDIKGKTFKDPTKANVTSVDLPLSKAGNDQMHNSVLSTEKRLEVILSSSESDSLIQNNETETTDKTKTCKKEETPDVVVQNKISGSETCQNEQPVGESEKKKEDACNNSDACIVNEEENSTAASTDNNVTTTENANSRSNLKDIEQKIAGTLTPFSCKDSNENEVSNQKIEIKHNLRPVENKPLETSSILSPLMLEESSSSTDVHAYSVSEKLTFSPSRHKMLDNETPCMLCDHVESNMDSKSHYNEYLCHLIVEHKLVIADVKLIAELRSYAIYWKKRFAEEPLDKFCSKIKTNSNSEDVGDSEEYYLLCDALPEDKQIREQLQFDKLKKLLLRQEFERKDGSFSRTCPFCNKLYQGNRIVLFNHMTIDHNFNIGHPDNIVNVRELLDEIQAKLDKLQCLFCENIFRDRGTLREHMRKKGHRRLNPNNKDYDKYYMINYLELGKNWLKLQSEPEKLDGSSDDWSGWLEESQKAYCFFCKSCFDEAMKVYDHMKDDHSFDFMEMREEMHLSFYQQIKLINYIRRQVHLAQQEGCSDVVTKIKDNLKASTKWNQPQYYFSTYEDDTILCQLEDKEGVFEPEDNFVIGEDGIDCPAIISNSVLTDLVVHGAFDS